MSAEMQARANALNARMEAEASKVLDDLERNLLRKVARASFSCAVKCYDTAGATGTSDVLEACTRNCQVPYQQSSVLVQNVSLTSVIVFLRRSCLFIIPLFQLLGSISVPESVEP
jgi:hypothetical protein